MTSIYQKSPGPDLEPIAESRLAFVGKPMLILSCFAPQTNNKPQSSSKHSIYGQQMHQRHDPHNHNYSQNCSPYHTQSEDTVRGIHRLILLKLLDGELQTSISLGSSCLFLESHKASGELARINHDLKLTVTLSSYLHHNVRS